jgi:hypothetical protein
MPIIYQDINPFTPNQMVNNFYIDLFNLTQFIVVPGYLIMWPSQPSIRVSFPFCGHGISK